jgi:hypothetical protein
MAQPAPFLKLLHLYLDPLALLRNITVGTDDERAAALQYNRRLRAVLLIYARRWTVIALACIASANPLASLAREELVMCVPFVGVELGFSVALCALVISVAVYIVLGLPERPTR